MQEQELPANDQLEVNGVMQSKPTKVLPGKGETRRNTVFLIFLAFGVLLSLAPWFSPGYALLFGIAGALAIGNPFSKTTRKVSKVLLQSSVVLLGFSMNLDAALKSGMNGFVIAAITIVFTLSLGMFVGKILKMKKMDALLISAGTAICGGSAIAAVGQVIGADEAEMSVAIGTVFLLNAVALFLFPVLGHAFGLSQIQFGTWAGIAIHDISSVVGASSRYGLTALQVATAVKLSRSLWIAPVAFGASWAYRKGKLTDDKSRVVGGKAKVAFPTFILLFIVASILGTYIPLVASGAPMLNRAATIGLTLTLLLIGADLSKRALASVGWRPLVQGLIIWAFIASVSLFTILHFA